MILLFCIFIGCTPSFNLIRSFLFKDSHNINSPFHSVVHTRDKNEQISLISFWEYHCAIPCNVTPFPDYYAHQLPAAPVTLCAEIILVLTRLHHRFGSSIHADSEVRVQCWQYINATRKLQYRLIDKFLSAPMCCAVMVRVSCVMLCPLSRKTVGFWENSNGKVPLITQTRLQQHRLNLLKPTGYVMHQQI